jgi:hypothetical protein
LSELVISYTDTIILIVPSSAWKLSIPLHCRALTSTTVIAFCPTPAQESPLLLTDVQELLQSGQSLEIQIQHNYDHLDVPVLEVHPVEVKVASHGLEIAFQIEKIIQEYDDLLAELSDA